MRLLRLKLSSLIVWVALAASLALPCGAGLPLAHAPARFQLRVMSYNIHVGFGMDKKLDLARLARVITEARADLVALQEVDRGVRRTNGVDQIAELARLTRMNYAFAPNLDYQGGKYGVAILSRFPILSIDHRRYANRREAERRGLIRVEVLVKGRKINFVTTHLDYQFADGRLFEAEQLLTALGEVQGPVIVAGDFNDEPTGTAYGLMLKTFRDAWTEAFKAMEGGNTFPADQPKKRIDYIFISRNAGLSATAASVLQTLASDHLPLVVDLELH